MKSRYTMGEIKWGVGTDERTDGRTNGRTDGRTEVWVNLHGSGVHVSLIRMMLKDPSSSTSHNVNDILKPHHVLSSKG